MTGALSCGRSRNLSPLLLRWFSPEGRDVRRRLPVCRAGRRDTLSRPWRSRGSTAALRGADGGGKAVPAVGAGLDTRDVGAARVAAGLARKGSLRGRDVTSVSGRSMQAVCGPCGEAGWSREGRTGRRGMAACVHRAHLCGEAVAFGIGGYDVDAAQGIAGLMRTGREPL